MIPPLLAVAQDPERPMSFLEHLEELRAAVTQALNWGASSGADLLVGLLVGVQTDTVGMEQRLRTCAADRTLAA